MKHGFLSNSDVCPVCGGSGWELYEKQTEGFSAPHTFSRRCTHCRDKRQSQDTTGVPPQFHNAEIRNFGFNMYSRTMDNLKKVAYDFLNNYRERWEKAGKGLYLWSKTPGSGKTFLACCVGKSVMMRYNLQFRFVTAPNYMAAIGESYKRERGMLDESQVYRDCPLLVLDDIGAQKSGDWQSQEMFRIVNERSENGKITIFTSNMPPDKLNLDDRTKSRIIRISLVLQMPEESIRQKQAQEEQNRFLNEILGS